MASPFEQASRRIIRRVGITVTVTDPDNVQTTPKAVFTNPERDALVRGKRGGLEVVSQQKMLRIMTTDVSGLTKDWRIKISGDTYYPAHWLDDGHGCTLIFLGNYSGTEAKDGTSWR